MKSKKAAEGKIKEGESQLSLDLAEGKKVFIVDLLGGKNADREVTLYGWVWRKRAQAESNFIMVRDSTGVIQVVVPNAILKSPLYIEQSLEVKGKLVKDERARADTRSKRTTLASSANRRSTHLQGLLGGVPA